MQNAVKLLFRPPHHYAVIQKQSLEQDESQIIFCLDLFESKAPVSLEASFRLLLENISTTHAYSTAVCTGLHGTSLSTS